MSFNVAHLRHNWIIRHKLRLVLAGKPNNNKLISLSAQSHESNISTYKMLLLDMTASYRIIPPGERGWAA